MALAKEHTDELQTLVKHVETTYKYMKPNYDRFNRSRRFVYKSALTDDDVNVLKETGKPDVEFNICEPSISKQLGEFAKSEPSISVSKDDGAQVDPREIKFVEDHGRHLIYDTNKNGTEYECFKDTMSGGFSFMKVDIDYRHEMSAHQEIKIKRVYDPTLCGFDPMAITPTKMDGRFIFELYPMSLEDFKAEYPKVKVNKIRTTGDLGGFSWAYTQGMIDIIMVCCFFAKKKKKLQIVTMMDGTVIPYDDYKEAKERYESDLNNVMQFPLFVGKPRWTTKTTICRYLFIKDQVLEYEDTIFKTFPMAYFPGNDMLIKDEGSSTVQLMTRPYVYNMFGVQRLKNFAGQCWANELENMVQHKFMLPKESLPEQSDLMEAWLTPQKPSTLVYNAYDPRNPEKQLPLPQAVPRVPMPPEIGAAFQAMDNMIEIVLGTFTPDNRQNNLSGDSIEEGSIQSNMAAMPYIVGFLQGWSHILQCCVEVMPQIYVLPRELPVQALNGKQSSVPMNGDSGFKLNYGPYDLNVKVEAGVNFAVQKTRALNQIIALMKVSPVFAKFINEEGLEVLLDNIEIRGVDALKEMVAKFVMKMQQEQEEAKKNNPEMLAMNLKSKELELKAKELELNSHHEMIDDQIEVAKLSLKQEEQDTLKQEAQARAELQAAQLETQQDKADAERARSQVDLAIKVIDANQKTRTMAHDHAERLAKHHHEKAKHEHQKTMDMKNLEMSQKQHELRKNEKASNTEA